MPARSKRVLFTAFSMQTAATAPKCDRKSVPWWRVNRVGSRLPKHSAPGGQILARQGHQCGAFQMGVAREQEMMVRPDEGTEPGLVQGRELRRETDQGIDEKYLLELLGPVAAGHQQMADLVLRIQEHDAHRVQGIGLLEAVDQRMQQLRQAVGTQQRKLARLSALQDRLVVGRLGGQFREPLLECLVFLNDVIHPSAPLSSRAIPGVSPPALERVRRNMLFPVA